MMARLQTHSILIWSTFFNLHSKTTSCCANEPLPLLALPVHRQHRPASCFRGMRCWQAFDPLPSKSAPCCSYAASVLIPLVLADIDDSGPCKPAKPAAAARRRRPAALGACVQVQSRRPLRCRRRRRKCRRRRAGDDLLVQAYVGRFFLRSSEHMVVSRPQRTQRRIH